MKRRLCLLSALLAIAAAGAIGSEMPVSDRPHAARKPEYGVRTLTNAAVDTLVFTDVARYHRSGWLALLPWTEHITVWHGHTGQPFERAAGDTMKLPAGQWFHDAVERDTLYLQITDRSGTTEVTWQSTSARRE